MSRYHRFRQHDGKGFGILVIDEQDVTKATVLHADLTDDDSRGRVDAYRACERRPIRGIGAMGVS